METLLWDRKEGTTLADKKNSKKDDKFMETMALNDNCDVPRITPVDSPSDFRNGIIEFSDEEENKDES